MECAKRGSIEFREKFSKDARVFLNDHEFGGYHEIDGHRVKSILTFSRRHVDEAQDISSSEYILYCRAQDISGWRVNQPVNVDGRMCLVEEVNVICEYMLRVKLTASE